MGQFDSLIENAARAVDILGYYPLALYDKTYSVIPEALGKRVLPPLVVECPGNHASYLQLAGKSFNTQKNNFYFRLENVQVRHDAPEQVLSFYFYFDIISGKTNDFMDDFMRFGVAEFSLTFDDPARPGKVELVLTIDFAFKRESEIAVGAEALHLGKFKLVLEYKVRNGTSQTAQFDFDVVKDRTPGRMELVNVPGSMYRTQYHDDFGLVSLLSSQVFVYKVLAGVSRAPGN